MKEVKTAFAKIKKYFADKGDATEGCINDMLYLCKQNGLTKIDKSPVNKTEVGKEYMIGHLVNLKVFDELTNAMTEDEKSVIVFKCNGVVKSIDGEISEVAVTTTNTTFVDLFGGISNIIYTSVHLVFTNPIRENGEGVDNGDDTKKTTENESTPSKQLFLMQMPSLTPLSSDDRQLGKSVLSPLLSPISSPFIESIGVSSQLPQAPLSSWESDERKERVFQLLESEIERYKEKLCDSEKKVASLTKELEKKTTELEEYKRLESKVSEGSCLLVRTCKQIIELVEDNSDTSQLQRKKRKSFSAEQLPITDEERKVIMSGVKKKDDYGSSLQIQIPRVMAEPIIVNNKKFAKATTFMKFHEIVKYVATIASINITDWAKEDYESIVKFFQIHSVHRDFSVDLTKYYSNHHLFKSDNDDKISGVVGEISDDEELDKRNKRKKSASSSPSASETEVVAQFKTIKILRRDLERLQNFEYLNDTLVDFFILYIDEKYDNFQYFSVLGISCTSFKHTDLVANKVFVPGCRDDHFFLFLFDLNFKKKSGTATLYDSLGRHYDDYLVHLQQFMNIFLTDFNIEFKSCKSCKRQQNGIDCGMYMISYMQYLSQKGCNDSEIATAPIMTRGELQALIGKYSVQ